jgi:uridine kinase
MKTFLTLHLYDSTGTFKLGIVTTRLFIVGLLIKLYAAVFFTSANFTELFIPFVTYFTESGLQNPYTYFFSINHLSVFPYPQLMLYIMALPGYLFSPFLEPGVFVISRSEMLLYHLPILLADITILIILSRWLKNKQRELLILYWLSPILLYINYLHSQLDVIPIALTFVFLYFLFTERWVPSFMFLGAAIATKFHIIILLPFVCVYLIRQYKSFSQAATGAGIVLLVFAVVNNVSLLLPGFQTLVFQNREQFKLFDLQILFGAGTVLYVIPFAYAILFLHSLTFRRFNRDTFVMFLGFSFGLLTLLIPPMPGWYYWIIPFFIYFYIKNDQASKIPYYLLLVGYFTYFAFTPTSDYVAIFGTIFPPVTSWPNLFTLLQNYHINAQIISNFTLTGLQAILCINVLWLYRRGVEESKKRKLYNMPYLIGIAGDSGSGKSTLADLLENVFNKANVAILSGDAMHKWERGNPMWKKFTHLNPQANTLHTDLHYAKTLQAGNDVYRRHYDHHTGTFTVPERLESKKVVIFEGLHSLYLTPMQQALDLKIFIRPEEQLRIHWKVYRDIRERGYSKDRVIEQIMIRSDDSNEFISSQAKHANIVVSLKSAIDISAQFGEEIELDVFLEIQTDTAVHLEHFIERLGTLSDLRTEHTFTADAQTLRFFGTCPATVIEQLSYELTPELYDISMITPTWSADYNGIEQLFICYYILQSLETTRATYGQ